eukprot:748002-Hanusia_phi.AAC.2
MSQSKPASYRTRPPTPCSTTPTISIESHRYFQSSTGLQVGLSPHPPEAPLNHPSFIRRNPSACLWGNGRADSAARSEERNETRSETRERKWDETDRENESRKKEETMEKGKEGDK